MPWQETTEEKMKSRDDGAPAKSSRLLSLVRAMKGHAVTAVSANAPQRRGRGGDGRVDAEAENEDGPFKQRMDRCAWQEGLCLFIAMIATLCHNVKTLGSAQLSESSTAFRTSHVRILKPARHIED